MDSNTAVSQDPYLWQHDNVLKNLPDIHDAAQLRKADQEVTATAMIHKLKGYSTQGQRYNNYLFSMYQDNQRLIAAHM